MQDATAQNVFALLAQSPHFFWFAVVVGLVVSIDVFVVEFTRDYKAPTKVNESRGRRWYMARLHAMFHAGGFLVYSYVLLAVDFVSFEFFDWFSLPEGVGGAFATTIFYFIILFVWWTYKGKIAEDHSEKDNPGAKVERYDMQFLVDLWNVFSSTSRTSGAVIAGSVAVDMLAVSALLKIWLLPLDGAPPVASMTGVVFFDILFFGIVIGGVVFLVVAAAHRLQDLSKSDKPFAMAALRLIEPLVIFYIMAGAFRELVNVLGLQRLDQWLNGPAILVDCSFSILMVLSLLIANSMSKEKLFYFVGKRSRDKPVPSGDRISWSDIRADLKKKFPFFGAIFGIFFGVLVAIASAFATGDLHDHLVEATGYFSIAMVVLSLLVLYLPIPCLDRWEVRQSEFLSGGPCPEPFAFWSEWFGAAIAISFLNFMMLLVIDITRMSWAPMLWSVYIVGAWAIFNCRKWRLCKTDRLHAINLPALMSAVGLASGIVAYFSSRFVSKLF